MEERLKSTKPLDDLKEQESELQHQNQEDQVIIQDENATPSEKEAAEARVAEKKSSHFCKLRLEKERGHLSQKVPEICEKYGLTVTAIFLATGVTIGVVISSITNALKATSKAFGNGLTDRGAKLSSMLPGLIGSIVSFLFKTAEQVVSYLAEHIWLLILAVVAFIFEIH